MNNFEVHITAVNKLLQNINPPKASRPDSIPTRFLKETAFEIAPALTLVYQVSLQKGKVPIASDWKHAHVSPLFNKGDRSEASNTRPIPLTSMCSEVIEHVLQSQTMKNLEAHIIITDQGHGFRNIRSCESQLIILVQDLAAGLRDGEKIDAVLLNFSKALGEVPRHRLAFKLHHYGIRGYLLQWIASFLANGSQQNLVEGQSSPTAPITSNVPHGTVIRPLLLLVYINDLPSCVSSTCRLFAHDSLLYHIFRPQVTRNSYNRI